MLSLLRSLGLLSLPMFTLCDQCPWLGKTNRKPNKGPLICWAVQLAPNEPTAAVSKVERRGGVPPGAMTHLTFRIIHSQSIYCDMVQHVLTHCIHHILTTVFVTHLAHLTAFRRDFEDIQIYSKCMVSVIVLWLALKEHDRIVCPWGK